MQTSQWAVVLIKNGIATDQRPFPRSKRAAFKLAEILAAKGHYIRIEKRVFGRTVHKTYNRPAK